MNSTPPYRRRSLMFTLGMLLSVTLVAQLFVTQRGRAAMGEVVAPAGWSLSFRAPAGWRDRGTWTDLLGAQMRVYTDRAGQSIFRVRRVPVSADTTPRTLAGWALVQLELELGFPLPSDPPSRASSVGPWPARLIDLSVDEIPGAGAVRVEVLAALAEGEPGGAAYTIELVSGRGEAHRHEKVWRSVIDSITFGEGGP